MAEFDIERDNAVRLISRAPNLWASTDCVPARRHAAR
jgi:hypothetical protein